MDIIELHAFAAAVATAMGDGWKYNEDLSYFPPYDGNEREIKHWANVTDENGAEIHFHNDSYRKKISIMANVPKDFKGNHVHMPSINGERFKLAETNVSYGRAPAAVAKQIISKIVDNARQAKIYFDEHEKRERETQDTHQTVIAELRASGLILPGNLHDGRNQWGGGEDNRARFHMDGLSGKVDFGRVSLELGNMPADEAIYMIKAYKSLRAE